MERKIHHLAIPLIGFALALFLTPAESFAVTAKGTVITNTASVTWSGATTTPTATASVTVLLKPAPPTVAYASTSPSTTVGAATPITVSYAVTSGANGTDNYDLTLSSTDSANLQAPTITPLAPISLGASMALNDVAASNTVVIPGLAADHGLAATETVVIGGSTYTISNVTDDGTNSTLTLSGSVTMTAGDPIYERRTVTFSMTTGLFVAATVGDGTHTLTGTAASATDGTQSGSAANTPVITVARATLEISKSAAPLTGSPGATITYTIVVTNPVTATASAANVTISDATPAFTSYVPGSGRYSLDGGTSWTSFADGALAGGVNVGTLGIGASVTVEFQVTIN